MKLNSIQKQIIVSVLCSNLKKISKKIISFCDELPEEFFDLDDPEDYSGYRFMSSGCQTVRYSDAIALRQGTRNCKDIARGREFYLQELLIKDHIDSFGLIMKDLSNKHSLLKLRY